jgi:hypothetical protein
MQLYIKRRDYGEPGGLGIHADVVLKRFLRMVQTARP